MSQGNPSYSQNWRNVIAYAHSGITIALTILLYLARVRISHSNHHCTTISSCWLLLCLCALPGLLYIQIDVEQPLLAP